MIAFVISVIDLLAFADDEVDDTLYPRSLEVHEMVEAASANFCAVLIVGGAMTGLAVLVVAALRHL